MLDKLKGLWRWGALIREPYRTVWIVVFAVLAVGLAWYPNRFWPNTWPSIALIWVGVACAMSALFLGITAPAPTEEQLAARRRRHRRRTVRTEVLVARAAGGLWAVSTLLGILVAVTLVLDGIAPFNGGAVLGGALVIAIGTAYLWLGAQNVPSTRDTTIVELKQFRATALSQAGIAVLIVFTIAPSLTESLKATLSIGSLLWVAAGLSSLLVQRRINRLEADR